MNVTSLRVLLALAATIFTLATQAQVDSSDEATIISDSTIGCRHRPLIQSIYASWGYNEEWYTKSSVHVDQSSLGNNYTLEHVTAHDHEGWNKGIFNKAFTIPQYNYRIGFWLNEKRGLAFEVNFDHTKYLIKGSQDITLKGTLNHEPANETIIFDHDHGFFYYLNNGANFLLFNVVKRWGLIRLPHNSFQLDIMGKAGVGPVVPHVENAFFGKPNNPHFQLGGWNTGLETALRATILRYAYIEFAQKVDYARYSGLKIYDGTAKQSFGTYELILTVGATVPTLKHNERFVR
jgi:hypothetical protein